MRIPDLLLPIARGASRRPPSWLLLSCLLPGLALSLGGGPAREASPLVPVPWRTLEFGASDWLNDVTLSARWSPLAVEEREAALIDIPDGAGLEPDSQQVAMLVATVEATTRWRSRPKRWSGEVWFLPDGGIPLQRVRSKLGSKATRKLYRYAAEGVYRVREEAGERSSSFHAFAQPRSRCEVVSDPALLLLLASSADLAPGSTRRLCVFNKKGVYEVELRSTAAPTAPVQFRRRAASGSWENESVAQAIRIEIDPRPAGQADGLEAFEFFELRPPLAITVDPRTRLPIAIEGAIQGFGAVRFELRQADASP